MDNFIFPNTIGFTIENQQINIDYESSNYIQFGENIFDSLQNINCVLHCYEETYQKHFWDYIEKSPDHCKTKVETHWKGKHCKPFYQTGRW